MMMAGCGSGAHTSIGDPSVLATGPATPAPDAGSTGSADAGGSASGSASLPSAVGPVAPAHARVIKHVEDQGDWGHCSACAADPEKSHPPIASWDFQQHQQEPSLDGSSLRLHISGSTPYANALHWTKFDGKKDYKNFLFEFDVYASPESLKAQNLEFDLFQGVNGRQFMFGTQCNYHKGIWQGWSAAITDWVDLPHAPCKKFAANKWTHVKWLLQRTDDGKLHYVSVTVNGTTHKVDSYQPSRHNGWDDVVGVQFQLDMNGDAVDYAIWVDRVTVAMW
jgi:hypothetical protein